MSDRLTAGRLVLPPAVAPRGARTWPRLPDYVVTRAVSSIPTTPGEVIQLGGDRAVIIATGTFAGVSVANKPTTAINTFDLAAARGVPLPQKFRWIREATSSGSVTLIGWELCEGETLGELAALVTALASSASSAADSAALPNRSRSFVQGGIDSTADVIITWTTPGFRYADVKNRGPGTVMVGSVAGLLNFALPAGSAINGYVGNATGFLVRGLSAVTADTIDWIEYGRS